MKNKANLQNQSQNQSDEQLVRAFLKGDQAAFEILVRNNLSLVYNFVFKYVHTFEQAEDVTQETFVKIWKNLGKFNENYKFRTWALTIARNTALDHLKKKGLVSFSAMAESNPEYIDNLADPGPSVAQVLENLDDLAVVGEAIAKLPENQRKVIELYYRRGFNFREISEGLKESINTVKTRHRRALAALRTLLGRE